MFALAAVLIPQTRQPIQVLLNKALVFVKPITVNKIELKKITVYNWKLIDEQNIIFPFEKVKGKVVLLNFWATWCPPCIAEVPSLQALYNDYSDKVVFLFITNDLHNEIDPFLKNNKYTFKVFRPISAYPEYFNITSIPRTFLIDKEGNIIIDENGVANWNSDKIRTTIDGLLK